MSILFDIKVDNKFKATSLKMIRELQDYPKNVHKFFVAQTPIDTGNARSRTSLSGNTINASYPYAQRLDQGYSKQAPRGMVAPTEQYAQQLAKKITGK
jgi:hypothetical protein